jgi:Phosphatidate phosphatase APP1, catalytic domain
MSPFPRVSFWLFASAGLALCSDIKRDEVVVFFPTLGQQTKRGWRLDIHGWIYEPEKNPTSMRVLRSLLGISEEPMSALETKTFTRRVQLFLVDNERRKAISIRLGDRTEKLTASAANGHFKARIDLVEAEFQTLCRSCVVTNDLLFFKMVAQHRDAHAVPSAIHLIQENGLSVISDIDDTIKVSQVLDRRALLRNTFYKPFEPVPGMAGVYQAWSRSPHAKFHYVSASPWQLYAPLAEFVRDKGFPAGTFHLRDFRIKDETFFDLFRSPERYKRSVIEPLLERFPKRRFVLVGDSGEKDPEIYGAIARKYPGQITRIFIRDITNEAAESERYRQAFRGLSTGLCRVFKEPPEIEQDLR